MARVKPRVFFMTHMIQVSYTHPAMSGPIASHLLYRLVCNPVACGTAGLMWMHLDAQGFKQAAGTLEQGWTCDENGARRLRLAQRALLLGLESKQVSAVCDLARDMH